MRTLAHVYYDNKTLQPFMSANIGRLNLYTECPRRNVPDFERVFLMLKYTDITQNTYVQS